MTVIDICLTCGHVNQLEAHHVAGRHNHATLTIPVCVDCHHILTRWQYAAGVELEKAADRTELDATRALVVGVAHVLTLLAQRHAELSWLKPMMLTLIARASSRLLDLSGDANRAGRWRPDPTAPPTEATPVARPTEGEDEWFTQMAQFLSAVAGILGDAPPLTGDLAAAFAANPAAVREACDRMAADPDLLQSLDGLLTEHTTAIQRFLVTLLGRERTDQVNERLLDEIRQCGDTAGRVLHELFGQLPIRPEDTP